MPVASINPWSYGQSSPDLASLMLRASALKQQQQQDAIANALRAQQAQSMEAYRQGTLQQRQQASQATLDQRAPLVQAQTGEAASRGHQADTLADINVQKLADAVAMHVAADKAGAAATRLQLPNGTSIQRGEGPTAAGASEIDLADVVGNVIRNAASTASGAASLATPRAFDTTRNVMDALGRSLQVGEANPLKVISPGAVLYNTQTKEPEFTAPTKPSTPKEYNLMPSTAESMVKDIKTRADAKSINPDYNAEPMYKDLTNYLAHALSRSLKSLQQPGEEEQAPVAQPDGPIYRHPVTGQRAKLINGQLVPIQ